MGAKQSLQFQQALRSGDEVTALQLFYSTPELWRLDPNKVYALSRTRNTPLHYAARRGLLDIYKEFLVKGGEPTFPSSKGQTCIHMICTTANARDPVESERRAQMLSFTIDYCIKKKKKIVGLSFVDKSLNSPLHLAATSGLVKCVEILVANDVPVTIRNIAGQTPMDCLQKSPYKDIIGAILEPKVVFGSSEVSSELAGKPKYLREESYNPYHEERLKQLREDILFQCSEILGLSRVHSETLLHANGWSLEIVVQKWVEDRKELCKLAGIEVPSQLVDDAPPQAESLQRQTSLIECEICYDVVTENINIPCGHVICQQCWQEYLKEKINSGAVNRLKCPASQCSELVPMPVIMSLVPEEIYQKYLKFGLDNFVMGKSDMKWCPHPGCGRAAHVPADQQTRDSVSQESTACDGGAEKKEVPRNVDCGQGHFFCWSCSKTAHDPCSCETWAKWEQEVQQRLESKKGFQVAAESVSDEVWVGENCKPCPSCKAPIYKDDGCNHMTCYKCNHEFCWVCRGRWRFHGDWTGGYFECNNYLSKKLAERKLNKAKSQAKEKASKKHGRYFKHVYERYKNHQQSLDFELALLEKADEKMTKLRASASSEQDVTFFEDAVRELLKCRHVLKASYALSYFLRTDVERTDFTKLLADLEKSTDVLAESVARPHLQTPRDKIILLTVECRELRRSLLPAARKFNLTELAMKDEEEVKQTRQDYVARHYDSDSGSSYDSYGSRSYDDSDYSD